MSTSRTSRASSAHDRAELAAEGARWGQVDEEGNVRLISSAQGAAAPAGETGVETGGDAADAGDSVDAGDMGDMGDGPAAAPGRIIGRMKGKSPEAALASFALKFRQITHRVEELEREMAAHDDKTRFAGRVRTLLGWVPKANALGDFDALTARLQAMAEAARAQMEENLLRKEEVVVRIEELAESSEWKQTAEVDQGSAG